MVPVATQHAVIGEIGMRQRDQRTLAGLDAERQVDVVVVAALEEPDRLVVDPDGVGQILSRQSAFRPQNRQAVIDPASFIVI